MIGNEFEINQHTYCMSRKLDGFKQFHIARRLAPVLAALSSKAKEVANAKTTVNTDGNDKDNVSALLAVAGPFADALADMTDTDTEYIINCCLDVTQRKDNGKWFDVRRAAGLMYQDMDMTELMGITFHVLQESMGSFFPSAVTSQ